MRRISVELKVKGSNDDTRAPGSPFAFYNYEARNGTEPTKAINPVWNAKKQW